MTRPLRAEYPGAFHHVINRGNAGEDVFKSLRDREKFLDYLEAASSRFSLRIHTYCLMTNHYHLLEDPGKSPVGGFILGCPDFVSWVKETFISSEQTNKEKPQLTALQSGVDLSEIVSMVGAIFGVQSEGILAKGKKKNLARDVAIYLSRNHARLSGKELGQHFGNVSGAAIAMRHKAVAEQLKKDKQLQSRIKRLEREILKIKMRPLSTTTCNQFIRETGSRNGKGKKA